MATFVLAEVECVDLGVIYPQEIAVTDTHTAPCPHLYVMCMYAYAHTVPTVTGEKNAYSVPKFKHTHT